MTVCVSVSVWATESKWTGYAGFNKKEREGERKRERDRVCD